MKTSFRYVLKNGNKFQFKNYWLTIVSSLYGLVYALLVLNNSAVAF
jgi:hypothetical protein